MIIPAKNSNHPLVDQYCVIGNPVEHSLSPWIHHAFAEQTGQRLNYSKLRVQPGTLTEALDTFFNQHGGRGCNITVPLKEEAFALAVEKSKRAQLAGAANTLSFVDGHIFADNTDGIGLLRDLTNNLAWSLQDKRILLLGAGGAARGVIASLFSEKPGQLFIANRTIERAITLAGLFPAQGRPDVCRYDELVGMSFDLIINATSASLQEEALPLPSSIFAQAMVYDMAYKKIPESTVFLQQAKRFGAVAFADGLGMLVEQAAESFFIWRTIRPDSRVVLNALRSCLNADNPL